MRYPTVLVACLALLAACSTAPPVTTSSASSKPPSTQGPSILLVTGGGWHDYPAQETLLLEGLNQRLPGIVWTVVHEGEGQPDHLTSLLQEENWAADFDLVIHNTGFGRVTDADFVEQMVANHQGTPAVLIHSAVHSYRYAEPSTAWFEFSGVQSMWHETEREFQVNTLRPEHPIMEGFPVEWYTPVTEELYVVEKIWGDITPLAEAHGVETGLEHTVVWTHEAEGVRVFATTLGHNSAMFEQAEYLDLVARGVRWALSEE